MRDRFTIDKKNNYEIFTQAMQSGCGLSDSQIVLGNRCGLSNGDWSSSMAISTPVNITTTGEGPPRMAQLETLEAKMASIEVSLSSATPRRRKGTSLGGGSLSTRSSPRPDSSRELRTALQDREAVIQNLRVQLGLNKLPRPPGTPIEDSDRPVAEQKLARLKIDSENKKIAIRNLRQALEKLDITDNIDVRIRQAELEYALGREELQLLSLVEEARSLQGRLEKVKPESNTLFGMIQSGISLSLHAVTATAGRWSACSKIESPGLWIEWALDGEGLYRGDRIIELDGKLVTSRTREELQRVLGSGNGSCNGKCQIVVARKKIISPSYPQQQLLQSQEDNLRLQHRISYLEDQVKELQIIKEFPTNGYLDENLNTNRKNGSHITSISISSPPVTPPEEPQIYQRGNFVTTIVGGKAVDNPPPTLAIYPNANGHNYNNNNNNHVVHNHLKTNVTKTIIKENGQHHNGGQHYHDQKFNNKIISASTISINSELTTKSSSRRERHLYSGNNNNNHHMHKHKQQSEVSNHNSHYYNGNGNGYQHARSVEHLNHIQNSERRRENPIPSRRTGIDLRSVKSLDFESDGGTNTDYASEPAGPIRSRPTPPKKPLRLSLQRAQSLQTVELGILELEKKRAMKRTHKGDRMNENLLQYIENGGISLQTGSLGRSKPV